MRALVYGVLVFGFLCLAGTDTLAQSG
ncbi:MAG: hypothetical protein RLZZ396_3128, partial [Planctomycetota bacterium]